MERGGGKRKEKAKSKEDHWKLLRLCIEEIREKGKWATRRTEEIWHKGAQ